MREISNVKKENVKDRIIIGLMDKWGLSKFVKVTSAAIIGAGVSALVTEAIIPSEPEIKINEKGE